jgi:hypothetical protein
MAKRIPLSLCLLTSVIFAGFPTQAAITTAPTALPTQVVDQQGIAEISPQIAAEQPSSAQATLTLQDLPPGFTELPPQITAEIASRFDSIRQELGQGNLKPENFFAFVNQQNFQIVLGFTGNIPNQPEQVNFDTSVEQLRQPEVQQRMMSLLQEKLKNFGGIKVTQYQGLPELNNLANVSTGVTLGLEMQGQPLRLDFAAFRRNSVGAFTAVMYPNNGKQPAVELGDVARKLDGQIVKLSADTNHSPLARVR